LAAASAFHLICCTNVSFADFGGPTIGIAASSSTA
jgi:hypothetical protein